MLKKAVIDTNVWVSAFINPAGVPQQIADCFETDLFTLVCSVELISELTRVLRRPKFAHKIHKDQVDRFVALIRRKAVFVELQTIPAISDDPKDNMFLACANAAECDFLVTGDARDLLCLEKYQSTRIVTPAQFLEILKT